MDTPRAARMLAFAVVASAAAAFAQDADKRAETPKTEPTAAELAKKLDAVLDDLSKRLGAVRTLRSRFEQKKWLAVFEDVVTSEGAMALAVPDKLRWEYTSPLKSVLTVDGRRARIERTSRKGVTTRKTYSLDDEPITAITTQQIFLWTRGDFAKARESYELALVAEKPLVVRATPKEDRVKAVVASVDLAFSDDRRTLTSVTLAESGDARTVISFVDVEIDPALPEALFEIAK
jgi:outer membrane lipoprotein-sorting protein